MSNFIAEASVVIRPVADPKLFVAAINEAMAAAQAAVKPIVIPVTSVATGAAAAGAAGLAESQAVAGAAAKDLAQSNAVATESIAASAALTEEQAVLATEAAAANVRLAKATAEVAIANKALTAALESGDAGLAATTGQTLALARAEKVLAAQNLKTAESNLAAGLAGSGSAAAGAEKSITKEGAAAAAAARHHEQLARGAGTAGLSFLGLRAQVLAASAAFIAGSAGALILRKSIGEASALNEEINKTRVVFKDSGQAIIEWSKTTATSMGISRVAALEAAGQFGNILVPMGVLPQKAAVMSQSLVRLASDMASFNNVGTDRALEAIRAGLVGQSRPLRVLGVQLTAARVQQEAFRRTGKESADALTQQDKILARYSLILRDSAIQAGDFAATQDRLANSSRILRAQMADLGGEIGQVTVPAITEVVHILSDFVTTIDEAASGVGDLAREVQRNTPLKIALSFVVPVIPLASVAKEAGDKAGVSWGTAFKLGAGGALAAGGGLAAVSGIFTPEGIGALTVGLGLFTSGLQDLKKAGEAAPTSLEGLHQTLVKIQKDALALGGPAGVAQASNQIQSLIATFSRGGPIGKEFARSLAGILADLQTGKLKLNAKIDLVALFDQAQAREEVRKKWGAFRDSVTRGLDLTPIDLTVKINVTADIRMKAAEAAGPEAALAEAKRQQQKALKSLRALLGLDPNATREEINAAIQSRKISASRQKAIDKALDQLRAADAVISSAATSAASEARSAASKQEQAANAAATARAKGIQHFIDTFMAGKETLLRRRLERAGDTETIADDLRINQGIRRILRARRRAIYQRIRDLNLHGEALRIAQAALAALGDQIASLNATIARETDQLATQRANAAAAARDAAIRHQEALLAIAEAQGNTAAERAALERIIALDTKRIEFLKNKRKKTREEKEELDALLVDRAQRNQALRELGDQTEKSVSEAKRLQEAEFAFLQTLTGFTANLIGNLIPGGATAGLVGGGGGGLPLTVPENAAPQGLPGGAGGAVLKSARASGAPAGPTQGQGERQIDLLHKIWAELHKLNRTSDHPEAKHQRKVGAAVGDAGGGGTLLGM